MYDELADQENERMTLDMHPIVQVDAQEQNDGLANRTDGIHYNDFLHAGSTSARLRHIWAESRARDTCLKQTNLLSPETSPDTGWQSLDRRSYPRRAECYLKRDFMSFMSSRRKPSAIRRYYSQSMSI
jgi:hypothetical protein